MTGNKNEIHARDLKWKKVEVNEALDDFDGFYGLEEIDGVDIKVVNGQAHFYSKDGGEVDLTNDKEEKIIVKDVKGKEDSTAKNVKGKKDSVTKTVKGKKTSVTKDVKETKDIKDEDVNDEDDDDSDIDEPYNEDDLIEFKNYDDIKEGELSAASSDSENDDDDDENKASDSDYESANDELKTNVFNSNIDLDDTEIQLVEWQKIDESLSMTLLQGLSKLGFIKPTEIQAKAIPYALKGEDIMGKASTGSGKTLAYGIPILENLIKSFHGKDTTSCISLIFTPTRELAQQVTKHLQNVTEKILTGNNKYAILSLTGGLSIQKQERLLKYKGSGRIIIATPGRFLELLEKKSELIDRFAEIKTLVLDEADRLLQDGHFDEFEKILKLLSQRRHQLQGKKSYWQTMIFSATFSIDLFNKLSSNHSISKLKNKNGEEEGELETVLRHLMDKIHFKSKPLIIDTNPEDKVSSQIKESLIECAPLERDLYTYYFLMMYPGQTLIFCNAIDSVKKLNSYLNFLNISSFQIHSSMTQKNRLKSLERYEKQSHHNTILGKPTVLIASDVAARGLDIPGIQHVIHYHLPRTADVYIHRSGRTARGTNEGVSVMICSPQEAMGPLRKLRKVLSTSKKQAAKNKKWQKTVPLMPIDIDVVSQLKERTQLAAELADHETASTSLHKDDNWLKKAADDLGIDVDSDDENKDTFLAKNKTKKMNKTMDKEEVKYAKIKLNELLHEKIRKDMRKRYLTGGLTNLADNLVKKRGHESIIGHDKTDALEMLKAKKAKRDTNKSKN